MPTKWTGAAHECSRCHELTFRKHTWCLACDRESRIERKDFGTRVRGRPVEREFSLPPPPPEGFIEADLRTGRPYNGDNDSDFADGPRPGGFGVRVGGVTAARWQ